MKHPWLLRIVVSIAFLMGSSAEGHPTQALSMRDDEAGMMMMSSSSEKYGESSMMMTTTTTTGYMDGDVTTTTTTRQRELVATIGPSASIAPSASLAPSTFPSASNVPSIAPSASNAPSIAPSKTPTTAETQYPTFQIPSQSPTTSKPTLFPTAIVDFEIIRSRAPSTQNDDDKTSGAMSPCFMSCWMFRSAVLIATLGLCL